MFRYLETAPTQKALKEVVAKLGVQPWDLLRRKEAEFKDTGLTAESSDAEVIKAMAAHPKLIERPIVIRGDRAVLGRPPEDVLSLVD